METVSFTPVYTLYILYLMKTKLQKWGNSLGVRLPKNIAEQKSLKEGVGVTVLLKNNQIVIEPVKEELSLQSMLAEVNENNLHSETDWSDSCGNEIW